MQFFQKSILSALVFAGSLNAFVTRRQVNNAPGAVLNVTDDSNAPTISDVPSTETVIPSITLGGSPIGGQLTLTTIGKGKFDIASADDIEIIVDLVSLQIDVVESTDGTISFPYEVQTSDPSEKVEDIFDITVQKGGDGSKTQVKVESKKKIRTGSYQAKVLSKLMVPKQSTTALKKVNLSSKTGSMVFNNKLVTMGSLTISTAVGSVHAIGWKSSSFSGTSQTGSLYIDGETDTADLNISTGSFHGALKGYSTLKAKVDTGSIYADLDPKASSKNTIDTSMGSSFLTISKNFSGKFSVSNSMGAKPSITGSDVKIDGSDGDKPNNPFSMMNKKTTTGHVREGESTLDVTSNMGSCRITFN